MNKNEVLNNLKSLYKESYNCENEIEVFDLLTNLAEKFEVSKEFIDYVVGQEF